MFRTAAESEQQTIARLIRAWDKQRPVTITYTKADGSETVRTIEVYDVTVTKAGATIVKAMDRQSGESRTWRVDRIVAYTIHSGTYTVARDTDETPRPMAAAPVVATPLTVAPAAVRIQQLADTLAA
jgi:predicted DNA-binding transcriptional regulator YafY